MDIFAFPPIAALLEGAYWLVQFLSSLVHPLVGTAAAAVAIVLLTVLVRAVLIPVSASQVKAEWGRRRIAPRLQALQKKYKKNPELLQRKTLELYRSESVSMFGGFLPTLLLQAPVLSLVYALFLHSTIGGHPNDLLTERLGSVPLGSTLWQAGWPGVLVFVGLFCVMGIVAWFSRRTALRLALPSEGQCTRFASRKSWLCCSLSMWSATSGSPFPTISSVILPMKRRMSPARPWFRRSSFLMLFL